MTIYICKQHLKPFFGTQKPFELKLACFEFAKVIM